MQMRRKRKRKINRRKAEQKITGSKKEWGKTKKKDVAPLLFYFICI